MDYVLLIVLLKTSSGVILGFESIKSVVKSKNKILQRPEEKREKACVIIHDFLLFICSHLALQHSMSKNSYS